MGALKRFADKIMLLDLFAGLGITAKNMFKKKVTVQYPEERWEPAARFRGMFRLDEDRCIKCTICAKDCPRRCAMAFSARTLARFSGERCSRDSEPPPGRLMRASAGMPFRYLSDSTPCASAVKVMQPMPSVASVSSRPRSISRFSRL